MVATRTKLRYRSPGRLAPSRFRTWPKQILCGASLVACRSFPAFPSRPGIETQEKGQTGTATGTRAPGKPPVAKPERHVASAKATSDKKTTPAKKPAKAAKAAKPAKTAKPAKRESGARQGSKTEKVLDLLKRPKGATLKELLKATGWQPHSLRGFLSGTVGKRMGLTVTSAKGEDGERSYSVKD